MSRKFFPWSLKWTAIHLSGPCKLKLSWRRHTRQIKEGGEPLPSPSHSNPQVCFCHVKGADLLLIRSIAAYMIFFCIHCFNFSGKSSTPCVHCRNYKCKPLYYIVLMLLLLLYLYFLLCVLIILIIIYYYYISLYSRLYSKKN